MPVDLNGVILLYKSQTNYHFKITNKQVQNLTYQSFEQHDPIITIRENSTHTDILIVAR